MQDRTHSSDTIASSNNVQNMRKKEESREPLGHNSIFLPHRLGKERGTKGEARNAFSGLLLLVEWGDKYAEILARSQLVHSGVPPA